MNKTILGNYVNKSGFFCHSKSTLYRKECTEGYAFNEKVSNDYLFNRLLNTGMKKSYLEKTSRELHNSGPCSSIYCAAASLTQHVISQWMP